MGNRRAWLVILAALFCGVVLPAALSGPLLTVGAAPEAQATATPGPAVCSLGGVPIDCPHAPSGNNLLGVAIESGSASFPYGVGTPIPVSGAGTFPYGAGTAIPVIVTPAATFVPYPTQIPVQPIQPNGAVAAQTPVAVAMAGQQVRAETTVVLPAQTPVAYTVGDVVTANPATALTFSNVCRGAGLSGYIVGAQLATDQSTNVAAFRLNFFQSAPPTLVADNAANTRLFANNGIRIGSLDFPAMTTATGTNTAATTQVNDARIAFNCAGGSTSISAVLETETAFTPTSAQQFYLSLQVARD